MMIKFLVNLLGFVLSLLPVICINLLFFPNSFISQPILAVIPNPSSETLIGLFVLSVVVLILKFVFNLIKMFLVGTTIIGLFALYKFFIG